MDTQTYAIPDDKAFGDEDYLPAHDLKEIADRLIEKHPELHHLYDYTVEFFWKRKGGESGRQPVLGKCAKIGGVAKAVVPNVDAVVWLAADHLRNNEATAYQVTAYVFHELLHTTVDEKGRLVLRGHDATLFHSEVKEYGLYDHMLQAAGIAFQQLSLVAA